MRVVLGIDHAGRPADYAAFARQAVASGFRFDWRYLCHPGTRPINATKVARPAEVVAARAAGLAVALIWQDTKHDTAGGYAAGRAHGAEARRQAEALGHPLGLAIYFAVGDYDAPASDHGRIADYLRGVAEELAMRYHVGGYGKRSVVEAMLDRGAIAYAWQSYGFSRPVGEVSPRAHVYQRLEQVTVGGVLCDVNEAYAENFGQWRATTMEIVSRAEWGARAPVAVSGMPVPTPRLWLHHTAAEWHGPEGVRQTQDFHMDSRGYNDIAYSFLVDDDGTIYEGRGAGVVGGHTEGDNDESHAICAMGNFVNRPPTDAMVSSIANLVRHGAAHRWWPAQLTGGHKDAPGASTQCPGDHLYARIPTINALAAGPSTPTMEDDMDPLCIPSWGKRQAGNRLPMFRLILGPETAAPYTAKVLAYPGAPLLASTGKVPGWRLGDSFGIPTLFMAGLNARPVGIEEGPGGAVVVMAEDGGTFDVAARP